MHCCPALRALSLPYKPPTTISPPPLPCSIKNKPITHLKSSHAPTFCSVHLPWLKGKLCSLRVWRNQMQQGLEPALLFCQITFTGTVFTMGSGNVDLQAQKSKIHISLPNLTVCYVWESLYFCGMTLYFRSIFCFFFYVSLPLTLFTIAKKMLFK